MAKNDSTPKKKKEQSKIDLKLPSQQKQELSPNLGAYFSPLDRAMKVKLGLPIGQDFYFDAEGNVTAGKGVTDAFYTGGFDTEPRADFNANLTYSPNDNLKFNAGYNSAGMFVEGKGMQPMFNAGVTAKFAEGGPITPPPTTLGTQYLLDKKGNIVNLRYGSLTENPDIQDAEGNTGYFADWSKPVGPNTTFGDYKYTAKHDDNMFMNSSPMEGYSTVFIREGEDDPYASNEVLTQSVYKNRDKIKSKSPSRKSENMLDHQVKPRHGVRLNDDGSKSSHLMRREYVKDRGWVAFPTLYQDDKGAWLDLGKQHGDNWEPIYKYASDTNEVYDFGEDVDAAIDFADNGSWKNKLADGGKLFGSGKIGDAFKLFGDYALSTVGLTDVIGDDNYRNQGMADASRVAENFGKGAGKVAANLLLPGVGGALMNTAQNTLGNIDGDDAERARVEQMRANPEAWGKYAGTIDQMSGAIDPLAKGASLAGEVGSMAAGNFMQHGNVLGDLSGLKNSFGQGILGQPQAATKQQANLATTLMGGTNQSSPIPLDLNNINIGQSVLDANQGQSLLGADPFANETAVFNFANGGTMNKKYANGGPIKMGEQVKPGSARHKEILELEKQNKAYQDRMAQLSPMVEKYGDPRYYTPEEISQLNPAFDASTVPAGSGILGFESNPGEEFVSESPFFTTTAKGAGTADKAYNFFTAPTQPQAVPEYDLMEDDIDMSISPEKVFSPIEAGVYPGASGNQEFRNIGYTYGYEGQKPESITTTSPWTGQQLFGADDSFTSGVMNQDFANLKGMQGVPIENVGGSSLTPAQQKQQKYNEYWAKRGTPSFPNGGNLPNTPDQLYMQQFRDDFDWNTYGKYQPKTGRHLMNDRMSLLPSELPWLGNVGLTEEQIKKLDVTKVMSDRNNTEIKSNEISTPKKAYGGTMNQMPDGGKFIEYNGPSHAGGGIDVDANGVPTANSGVAEVEGGETLHDNGIENYIFSDRLVVNPGDKKKKTFADLSKKINNKYKNTEEDPIAQNTRKLELENLKVEQENLKQMMGDSDNDYACGGKMKHPNGGYLSDIHVGRPEGMNKPSFYASETDAEERQTSKMKRLSELNPTNIHFIEKYDPLYPVSSRWLNMDLDNAKRMKGTDSTPSKDRFPGGGPINTQHGLGVDINQYLSPTDIQNVQRRVNEEQVLNTQNLGQPNFTSPQLAQLYGKDLIQTGIMPEISGGYYTKEKKAVGGGLDPMTEKVIGNMNTALDNYNKPLNSMYGIAGLTDTLSMLNSTNPMDRLQATTNQFDVASSLTGELADKGEYWDKRNRSGKLESGDVMPQADSTLPQDTINPLGYLASNVGNIYDLTEAAKETPKNQFGRMTPEHIDLSAQRAEMKNQAAVSRAIARENARNAPSMGGAMTNRVIANALINSGLGSQLSQSYMTEANQNVAIDNQAKQINLQTQIQEKLADQQDLAMRKSTISQAMHNIGMNTQGYVKDLKSAKVGNINNKMWVDMVKQGKYVDYDFDSATGTFVMKLKDGRVITKKGDEITEVKPDNKG